MNYRHENQALVVNLEGELDFSNSSKIKSEIRELLKETDQHMVLNLRELTFIDSSGVGVMISLLKTTTARGGQLILSEPRPDVAFVFKMTKVDQILKITASMMEAMAALSGEA